MAATVSEASDLIADEALAEEARIRVLFLSFVTLNINQSRVCGVCNICIVTYAASLPVEHVRYH